MPNNSVTLSSQLRSLYWGSRTPPHVAYFDLIDADAEIGDTAELHMLSCPLLLDDGTECQCKFVEWKNLNMHMQKYLHGEQYSQ